MASKTITNWHNLPRDVQDAALQGLRDPSDSGAPYTEDEVLADYNAGVTVAANLGGAALARETSVFCGDCLREIPYGSSCAHIIVGKRGKRTRND